MYLNKIKSSQELTDLELAEIKKDLQEEKEKNAKFRHSYEKSVTGLMVALEHLGETFDLKLDNIGIKIDNLSSRIKDE